MNNYLEYNSEFSNYFEFYPSNAEKKEKTQQEKICTISELTQISQRIREIL